MTFDLFVAARTDCQDWNSDGCTAGDVGQEAGVGVQYHRLWVALLYVQ